MDRWEEEVAKLNRLPRTNRTNRNYARSFFGAASDQQMDKQGRVQIPQSLRSYAGLDKDVVVLGVADRVEIWDPTVWESLSHEADDLYAGIEESLSEEGT
jgi:MraZ protein